MTDIVRYDLEPTNVGGFMVIEATESPTGKWVTYEAAAQAIEEIRLGRERQAEMVGQYLRRAEAAEAEVTRLREALRPFANLLDVSEASATKDGRDPAGVRDDQMVLSFQNVPGLTVGDFRRARTALGASS